MIHVSTIAGSIVAPTLFRPEFSHSLDPKRTFNIALWGRAMLREKPIKIDTKVVQHGRNVTFRLAEVVAPRNLFREILSLIDDLRPRPVPS